MSVSKYKKKLYDAIIDLLWRQWVALGVAGYGSEMRTPYTLDPEALLVFSSAFCRCEQRLYDLIISWLLRYGALVNTTRLKALSVKAEYKDLASLAYIAALCCRNGDKRWQRLADNLPDPLSETDLFVGIDGCAKGYVRRKDSFALQYGFIRNEFEKQEKILRQLPDSHATLLLRLRGMFGVNARADVILLLLGRTRNLQELSEASGFVRGTVREILNELELVNLVNRVSGHSDKGTFYSLDASSQMMKGHDEKTVLYPRWSSFYDSLGLLWQSVSSPLLASLSEETFHGELGLLFRESLKQLWFRSGVELFENLPEKAISEIPERLTLL